MRKSGSASLDIAYARPILTKIITSHADDEVPACGSTCEASDNFITILGQNFGIARKIADSVVKITCDVFGEVSCTNAEVINTFAINPACGTVISCPSDTKDDSNNEMEAIVCAAPNGPRANCSTSVTISGQESITAGQDNDDSATPLTGPTYISPAIKIIKNASCGADDDLSTEGCRLNYLGGDRFVIEGTNFGPVTAAPSTVTVSFKNSADGWVDLEAGATVSTAQSHVTGQAAAWDETTDGGVTMGPGIRISINGVVSAELTPIDDLYEGPAIGSVERYGMIYGDQFALGEP